MTKKLTKTEEREAYLATPVPELTKKLLRSIGEALGGRHWQSDVAREAAISKSQITRYLRDKPEDRRIPSIGFVLALDRIMVDKIEDVVNFIGEPPSPNAGNANVTKGIALIRDGIALLRLTSPRVARAKIVSVRKAPPGPTPGKKRKKKAKPK